MHTLDAARLFRLALESAPEEAAGHFGFLAMFAGADNPASSALTRQRPGWTPTEPGLIADLNAGHYFA